MSLFENLIATLLLVLAGVANLEVSSPDASACEEDEIQISVLCVHSEGDGWRLLP